MVRPSIVTPAVQEKLKQAYLIGCTNIEAMFAAGISKTTLYKFFVDNPEFKEKVDIWKANPVFQARTTVMKAIKTDPDLAFKVLERLARKEFATRVEKTGADGGPVKVETLDVSKLTTEQLKAIQAARTMPSDDDES